MGAKQSKRSVDITTTPKKGEDELAIEGEGKVEQLPEVDLKITTNGAIHTEIEYADKDESSKEDEEPAAAASPVEQSAEVKENGVQEDVAKTVEGGDHQQLLAEEKTTTSTTEESKTTSEQTTTTPSSETKKSKDKSKKKKWSFRSISFSKKDKSKPAKDLDKNGEVEEVAEENVEAPIATAEETPKTEEATTTPAPLENGVSTEEEASKQIEEVQVEETNSIIVEPKQPEPIAVKVESPVVVIAAAAVAAAAPSVVKEVTAEVDESGKGEAVIKVEETIKEVVAEPTTEAKCELNNSNETPAESTANSVEE